MNKIENLKIAETLEKDDKLAAMVEAGINVAQFISINKDNLSTPKYSYIKGVEYNSINSTRDAIIELIKSSRRGLVNIRSFSLTQTKGNRFVMDKTINDIDEIIQIIQQNAENGLNSIVNENIDVNDGGVSGVIIGNLMEFAPKDTPRCVEKEGVCSLPKSIGYNLLNRVYGFIPNIPETLDGKRVEFSIHPMREGVYGEKTIIWEYETKSEEVMKSSLYTDKYANIEIKYPNKFSEFIGDKVFGLLLADILGIKVPQTQVIGRNIAPFKFGKWTKEGEVWTRTAPTRKQAGLFTTVKGYTDPFKLMQEEDPSGKNIGSILIQDSVKSVYSGSTIVKKDKKNDLVEGVEGRGDGFMVGDDVGNLPKELLLNVEKISDYIRGFHSLIGDVSYEWVYDGVQVWLVQLNQLRNSSNKEDVIVDGSPTEYIVFESHKGLNQLRDIIKEIKNKDIGIEIVGNIGITSHFGDLMRNENIPSKIKRNN